MPTDVTGLEIERNVLRHLPVPAWIRLESGSATDLLRVVGAGLRVGAPMRISTAEPLPEQVVAALARVGLTPVVEDEAAWRDRSPVSRRAAYG